MMGMTEKRFKNVGKNIFQYGEWYCSAGGEHCADVIAEALNILISENKQLKDKYNEQSVQYEELEEQVERLLDFKDNVFNLIDELIKKAEKDVEDLRKDAYEKGYAYNPYYYWGVAHGLEKLKKELRE